MNGDNIKTDKINNIEFSYTVDKNNDIVVFWFYGEEENEDGIHEMHTGFHYGTDEDIEHTKEFIEHFIQKNINPDFTYNPS